VVNLLFGDDQCYGVTALLNCYKKRFMFESNT